MSGEAREGPPSLDPTEFRRVLGHFATGVTVVTAMDDAGVPRGLTASAVASVSLHPPLVLVCVDRAADTHDAIRGSEGFAINVLDAESEALSRRFAADDPDGKYEGVGYRPEASGAPVLEGALAWVDCRLRHAYEGGDHTIYVGEVLAGDAGAGDPLLYFRGGYRRMAP